MRYLLWRQKLAHLLCETSVGLDQESDTIGPKNNNNVRSCAEGSEAVREPGLLKSPLAILQPPPPPPSITISARTPSRLSLEHSFSAEEDQQKSVECTLQPARVYTITSQHSMLMSNKESLELDVLKEKAAGGGKSGSSSHSNLIQPSSLPSSNSSSTLQYPQASSRGTSSSHHHHGNHHHGLHHHHSVTGTNASLSSGSGNQPAPHHHPHHHHHLSQPPLHTSVSAHNIRSWGEGAKGDSEGCSGSLVCETCGGGAPSRSQGSLDLESASRETGKHHRRLERMWSVDRMTGLERGERAHDTGRGGGGGGEERESKPGGGDESNWFPKENMFSFQTATTTMQA
ncbi:hypothetical protein NQD34_009056 [Periophthalmus magnuspinnatus]|nr:hypothetical protein NQD34_009056 [Periophthalmus magnuspinnatus]